MKLLTLLPDSDIKLKQISKEVETFDVDLMMLCEDMIYTMKQSNGIGLAAPQCGIMKRVIIVTLENNVTLILINPKIKEKSKEDRTFTEGCLSFPNVYVDVKRSDIVTVEYQDLSGQKNTREFNNLSAIIVQHEIDHLNGITMRDHVSRLKWEQAVKKSKK